MKNQMKSSSIRNNHGHYYSTGQKNSINLISSSSNCPGTIADIHYILDDDLHVQQRYNLLTNADIQMCRVPREKSMIDKNCFIPTFLRWHDHYISLEQNEIITATNKEYTDRSIAYSDIEDIFMWSQFKMIDWFCPFRMQIVTNNYIYFFKFNKLILRDQLFYSIEWKINKFKYERILRSTNNPEVLLKEIVNLIVFTMKTPIDETEVHHFLLEIIFEILQQEELNLPYNFRENVIEALSPLLVKTYPSEEMCNFFNKYCRDSQYSQIVIEMFTPTIQKILKHNTDFSKYLRMRILVQEYLLALNYQNNGLSIVEDFIKQIHGPTMFSPFLRVLPNLISVCLAGIYQFFQDQKKFNFKIKETSEIYEEKSESELICYMKILQTLSTYYDWRHHLGLVLQPIPFTDETLRYKPFVEILKNIIKNLVEDKRCEVHRTVLSIRQDKDGWFEMFCLNGIICNDNGKMFSLILNKLISCCCRRKSFLITLNKLLPCLLLPELCANESLLDTLCAMLEFDVIENLTNKLQIISTLKSTPIGLKMYAKVCEKQSQLEKLQSQGGPTTLKLSSYSTDNDLSRLLSTGPLGNLKSLNLGFTNVTSACAEHLIKLPKLKSLNLRSTRFNDIGLEIISEHLNQLEEISLSETPITDKGLIYLARMKTLRYINLSSTKLSDLAILTLKV